MRSGDNKVARGHASPAPVALLPIGNVWAVESPHTCDVTLHSPPLLGQTIGFHICFVFAFCWEKCCDETLIERMERSPGPVEGSSEWCRFRASCQPEERHAQATR